jgi:hypothetical protein
MNALNFSAGVYAGIGLALALGAGSAAAATAGLVIKHGGLVVADVVNGVPSGELSVPPGEDSPELEVFWLDEGQNEFQPAVPPHTMSGALSATGIATFTATGPWTFTIRGDAEGMTELELSLLDGGTPIYTSPGIEVHVEEEHIEADGIVLRSGGLDLVSTWRGESRGRLETFVGQDTGPIDVVFLAPDSSEFQPEGDHFQLDVALAGGIATWEALGPWQLRLRGLEVGHGSAEVKVWHEGHYDFEAGAVPLYAYQSTEVEGGADNPVAFVRSAPNPTSGRTRIRWSLSRAGDVDVAVFDPAGRRVADVFRGRAAAGEHESDWRPDRLAAGLYLVRAITIHGARSTCVVVIP